MDNNYDFDWMVNGKIIPFKFSKFLEQFLTDENYAEIISYFESVVRDGYESQLNDYCKRPYCKSLYHMLKQEESIEKCVEIVDKITTNSEQMPSEKEHYNQYVNSILFLVKKIKKSNNPNFKIIYDQLSKLNPDILSTNEMELVSQEGKDYINVSSKELYYTLFIKSLIKLEKFDVCITVAEQALRTVSKWNYDNDVWITSRVHYAKCRIANDFEEEIKDYIDFAKRLNKWFIYSKIADVLFRQGYIYKSIIYYAKGIITANRNDMEGLVNVFYEFATIILEKHEDIAKKLFIKCYQIREKNGWKINHSLKFYMKLLELSSDTKINFKYLQREIVKMTNMTCGNIKMYNAVGNFGFIKVDKEKDIYFKGNKKKANKYKVNTEVYFDVDFDNKVKKNRAVNLFLVD